MPILEKAPQKMAAKTPSSEEEPVSDFWSPVSYPCSPHSPTLASRIVLYRTGPQHLPVHQPCPRLGMKSRLQSCPELAEESGRAWRGGEWLQGMLKNC